MGAPTAEDVDVGLVVGVPGVDVSDSFVSSISVDALKSGAYAMPRPTVLNTVAPCPAQVIPSTEVAMVFVPSPKAIQRFSDSL